ncbi:uncharacterized protein LOC143028557 isoform X4 [Oratosquilla oratoria]|uniref:uncharacterized protein LOC143028557 isoform X4 n=1 Tax=Oratosquilla oratoria TaxID=337810 RepID=UPI003F76FE0E
MCTSKLFRGCGGCSSPSSLYTQFWICASPTCLYSRGDRSSAGSRPSTDFYSIPEDDPKPFKILTACNHVVVTSGVPTAIVTTVVPLGPQSTHMICPHCHAEVDTATKSEPSLIAYLSGFVIALLGCWMGCCLLPCCIPECMNVQHTCPNCRAFLGKYKRG